MRCGCRLWVVWALGCIPLAGSCQCLRIWGTITDLQTLAPIAKARIVIKTEDKIEYSDVMNGKYQTTLPCGEATILVEAKGYGRLSMNYSPPVPGRGEADYFVPFLLLPIEHQTSDQPYVQSEQSHTELRHQPTGGQHTAKRVFRVTDAHSEKTLSASICLYYTQSARKNCFSTNAAQPPEITFTEPDIIAVEVDAPGYQSYKGNLILDDLDSQSRTYTIRLQREVTVATLYAPDDTYTYSLLREGREVEFRQADRQHHYLITEPGSYQLRGADSVGEVIDQKDIGIKSGLNILTGFSRKAPVPEEKHRPTGPVLTGTMPVPGTSRLYFDQSEYRLRPASRLSLDSLATWLRHHPAQRVHIQGHTDNVGNARRNQTLSEFRAKVVCTYLVNRGVYESNIRWEGVGSQFPDAPNDTEANRQRNRRVVIFLSATSNPND